MPRWKGHGRHSRPGYSWRHAECEYCGLKYRNFRVKDACPWIENLWAECLQEQLLEVEARDRPDPSKPINRRSVLGRMFQYKQKAWQEHTRECERGHMYCEEE